MIIKAEMESKRALKAKSVVDEQLDSFREQLEVYVHSGGYSGYSIDEDDIITLRR